MQNIKFTKKVDGLGRINIPTNIRREMNLSAANSEVELYYDEENQMLGIKPADLKSLASHKINSLIKLSKEISPNKFEEVVNLLDTIKKILGIDNLEGKE
jgi:AbrB family looped-hinge helix DNA binding protein